MLIDPLVPPLNDSQTLIELLQRVTNESSAQVAEKLYQCHLHPGKTVADDLHDAKIEPYKWSEDLIRFYSETTGFLFDSTAWNRHPEKLRMRGWIGKLLEETSNEPLKILCFGDGLGFDSLYFALAGHEVTYYEMCGPSSDFARLIFTRAGADLTLETEASKLPVDYFDVVICLDVLEHVPNPPECIEQFAGWLNSRGRAIISAPFYLVNRAFPTHLDSNRKYSGNFRKLFKPFGFEFHEACIFWNPIVVGKRGAPRRKGVFRPIEGKLGGIFLWGARIWSSPYGWLCSALDRIGSNRWSQDLRQKLETDKTSANAATE